MCGLRSRPLRHLLLLYSSSLPHKLDLTGNSSNQYLCKWCTSLPLAQPPCSKDKLSPLKATKSQGKYVTSLAVLLAWLDMKLHSNIVSLNRHPCCLCRIQEMRLAKIMAQGRHIMLMLDPTQQHNPQLHMETTAQLATRSPCTAVQEAHAARVMFFLPLWLLHYTLLCLRKLRS